MTEVKLARQRAIDFRKNVNGLASPVELGLDMNAFGHAVFVFGNVHKNAQISAMGRMGCRRT